MMQIWFNAVTSKQSLSVEGQCQCQCDNVYTDSSIDLTLTEKDLCQLLACSLKQAASLYIQKCTSKSWLVCDPIGLGNVVVLDTAGLSFLEYFRVPSSLEEVLPLMPDVTLKDLIKTATVLYQSGLLQDNNSLAAPHKDARSDTLTAWLHVTNACQLRCHYCYLTKNTENMAQDTAL